MVGNMRNTSLDNVKTFLVLLVVLGHVIQSGYSSESINFDESLLFQVIYSFHMPLFMAVSGYLFDWEKPASPKKYLVLLIPFFSWGIINAYIDGATFFQMYEVLFELITKPDSGLWYLFVLCQILLICQFVKATGVRFRHSALTIISLIFFRALSSPCQE